MPVRRSSRVAGPHQILCVERDCNVLGCERTRDAQLSRPREMCSQTAYPQC